jgi:TonB family protein
MKKKYTLTCLFLLISLSGYTQKKVKEYYENGKLKFEGKYVYTWKQDDFLDVLIQDGPANKYHFNKKRDLDDINMFRNIVPTKSYEGFCKFYHPGGQPFFEGSYTHGVPDGKFTYWWENGTKSSEVYFVNGMADGAWLVWESDGKLRSSFSYKAIPQDMLATIYHDFVFEKSDENDEEFASVFKFLNRKDLLDKSSGIFRSAYSQRLRLFKECFAKDLFKTTLWDGKFLMNKNGNPYLEFYFSDNVPSGTWKLWEEGKLAFECSFTNGKITAAKDYLDPESNNRYERILKQKDNDSLNFSALRYNPSRAKELNPEDIPPVAVERAEFPEEEKTRQEIFTYVEQMPEFPGGSSGLKAYLDKNLVYPKEALKNKIQGKAMVQIIVMEDGRIDTSKIKIQKSLGYGTDQEVIRLIKNMPVWRSGKQNGRAVQTLITIPVLFEIKP